MDFQESRTWVEINLDIFENNLKIIRKHIGDSVKLLAVVKADAYGHGAVQLAKICEENEVDHFAVACLKEGVELRNAGIKKPILVLSYIDYDDIDKIIQYDLIPTVYDFEFPNILNQHLKSINKISKVHIKLDTGMTRLGFDASSVSDTIAEIEKINNLSNIEIDGIFTHFADSDNEDLNYCQRQQEIFSFVLEKLEDKGIKIPLKHTCNSAGVIACRDKHLDMVRCGIILYGYYPEVHLKDILPGIKPFLSWKAKISQVREVLYDTTVGYGRTKKVSKGTKLAAISVGYADGYRRSLSNNFYVLINGKKAPVVGRVCMDQIIVDITGISDVKKGDDVILIGKSYENEITADDMANKTGTISYEILCDIAKRVERVYIRDKK